MSRRVDGSTKCGKGIHEWTEDNIYINPTTGVKTCRACKADRNRLKPEERHKKGSNYCRRGHEYTPENTMKRVVMVDGKKTISRTCIACKRYQGKNGYYSTSVNK